MEQEGERSGGRRGKLAWLVHRYYAGKLPTGILPPNICIEIRLWEQFGWGPEQTERLTQAKIREIFIALEQRRVTMDAITNLGPPDMERMSRRNIEKMSDSEMPPA
jgi:hypothetical protein